MPSWTDSLKSSQGFVRGISPHRDTNSGYIKYDDPPQRISSWRKTLDEAGAGLLKGMSYKKEKKVNKSDIRILVYSCSSCAYRRPKHG